MPRGITQCYLPPGRGDIPALSLSQPKLGLDLTTPETVDFVTVQIKEGPGIFL